jgi:putative hydrolase of the HAD superfamily
VYPLDLSRTRQFAQISTNRVFRDPVSTAKVRGEDSALTAKQLQDVLVALFLEGELACLRFWSHSTDFARIHLVMHVYTCIIRFMHDTAKRSAIQGLSQKRSVRAVVFDYGNVLCLEQTLEDMKGMALVCGIPHERFSELYWKLRPPYDRGDIDGPAYWTAVVDQQELGLSRDQIATLIKLDSESITRPNEGAVQWAKLLHHEGFPLTLLSNMPLELSRHVTKSFPSLSTFEYLIYSCDYGSIKPELVIYRNCLELLKAAPQDILYLDDRAENVEAAARLGISSVLFDTVETTASRVESRFDIPVPSYGRCR